MIFSRSAIFTVLLSGVFALSLTSKAQENNQPPKGFKSLFNGKDLSGWHGLGTYDPRKFRNMTPKQYKEFKANSLKDINKHWSVKDGIIVNDGHGLYLSTDEEFGDFEFYVDWKMLKECGDSGIYLRNCPQIQIWDPNCKRDERHGANRGSGALWNNKGKGKWPLVKADKPVGEWNRLHVVMIGEEVTIRLNGQLIVHEAPLENYFDRKSSVFPVGNIQLQTHGSEMHFRNVFIREIERTPPESGKLHKGKPVGPGWKNLLDCDPKDLPKPWTLENGVLTGTNSGGKPQYLFSEDAYPNFEMHAIVKLTGENNNGGLFFRATEQDKGGAKGLELDMGVGKHWGLLQNVGGGETASDKGYTKAVSVLKKDDWNHYYVIANGERIEAWLNGVKVVDSLYPRGPKDGMLALQIFRGQIQCKDAYVRPLKPVAHTNFVAPKPGTDTKDGFEYVFNGKDLTGWTGNVNGYAAEDGKIVCLKKGGGNLYIDKEYSNFHFKFEFKVQSGANNGLGIRAVKGKDAAYHGMELQILDNTAPGYLNLQPYQYHASIYGVQAALRGYQKPLGEWNYQEVIADGNKIKIILNGETIVDADLSVVAKNGTIDKKNHPGLFNKSGYIGFLGHGHRIEFRNIRIKELK